MSADQFPIVVPVPPSTNAALRLSPVHAPNPHVRRIRRRRVYAAHAYGAIAVNGVKWGATRRAPVADTSSRADTTAEADLLGTNAFEEADDAPRLRRPTASES